MQREPDGKGLSVGVTASRQHLRSGGERWSLADRRHRRDLLGGVVAAQPANLTMRKAMRRAAGDAQTAPQATKHISECSRAGNVSSAVCEGLHEQLVGCFSIDYIY